MDCINCFFQHEVPPISLELFDADGDELLRNKESLSVAEGETKTVVCRTNAPTKPAVDLEWMIPIGLNVTASSSIHVQDVLDVRLSVPVLTLSFTSYVYDEDIELVCRVASSSSFDNIRASIYIKNEGEHSNILFDLIYVSLHFIYNIHNSGNINNKY